MSRRDTLRKRRAVLEALKKQDGKCFYCKEPLACELATADHRLAKKQGGTIARSNIAASCRSCNRAKADFPESFFFQLITGKRPPRKGGADVQIIWASRRIWRRTHKACARISGVAA